MIKTTASPFWPALEAITVLVSGHRWHYCACPLPRISTLEPLRSRLLTFHQVLGCISKPRQSRQASCRCGLDSRPPGHGHCPALLPENVPAPSDAALDGLNIATFPETSHRISRSVQNEEALSFSSVGIAWKKSFGWSLSVCSLF